MDDETLISPAYLAEQRRLHADPRGYGGKGDRWAPAVRALAKECDARSILDYGAGQGTLEVALADLTNVRVVSFDPAVDRFAARPEAADLVVCTDVLEHCEPEFVGAVIAHISALARKAAFIVVSVVETSKILSDGRNAHICVQPGKWWSQYLRAAGGFDIQPLASRAAKEWACVAWKGPRP